jgi:hypothetical protein
VSLFLRLLIAGVVDTGNKLITGVMESIKIQDEAQSPVSMTPAINTKVRISPRVYVRTQNDPVGFLRGPGETDSREKPEDENLMSDYI